MDQTVTGLVSLATVLMGVLIILSLMAITYLYHYFNGLLSQQQSIINSLRKEIEELDSSIKKDREKLAQFEKSVDTKNRQQQFPNIDNSNFDKAKKLLQKGTALDQVASDCKLAQGEAELVKLANRMDRLTSVSS